jgi:hypothetical protein
MTIESALERIALALETLASPRAAAADAEPAPRQGPGRARKTSPPAPAPEKLSTVVPVAPSATPADLMAAVSECVKAHSMAVAKERLGPYAKVSDVPEAELAAVIARMKA